MPTETSLIRPVSIPLFSYLKYEVKKHTHTHTHTYIYINQSCASSGDSELGRVSSGTKPNPFEIVLLQTTRKENNWKTEVTLERAVVTLETDRIKGSNP
jgi:hypothetical protein